jgi:hypothetical protein
LPDATPAKIYAELPGGKIELILPGIGWTFDEALLAKTATGGLAVVEIEERLYVGDPDAWLAVLRISYQRAGVDFPEEEIGEVDLSELAKSIWKALQVAKSPPPKRATRSGARKTTRKASRS